jgi:hypothetical protein
MYVKGSVRDVSKNATQEDIMNGIRVGSKMSEAAEWVTRNPGITKWEAAMYATRNERAGSVRSGYAAVDRAIKAGIIKAHRCANGSYQLFPAGWDMDEVCR